MTSGQLASPLSYRQLSRSIEDEDFRAELASLLPTEPLVSLSRAITAEGAVSMTGLICPGEFDRFRRVYDGEMQARGSCGPLHSYLNISSSAPLMSSPGLWDTIAHPLYVVAVAYALGGPVKIIDLRAKDTQPLDVVARDNTLHLDNSPFIDEYKVVATWTLGTARGPSGQGLTYLPGTNKLFRNCFVDAHGTVWSDEDACIFPTGSRVDEVLEAQAGVISTTGPAVVHLAGLDRPCSTIFAASRLVHHRYRTSAGAPRSSVMATFHRVDDGVELMGSKGPFSSPLHEFLAVGGGREEFLAAVSVESRRISAAANLIAARPGLVVDAQKYLLKGFALEEWHSRQRQGVTLNRLRSSRLAQTTERNGGVHEWLVERLLHDLQGPLNMPFFPDLRDAQRRRARIWIREMSPERLSAIVKLADRRASSTVEALAGRTIDSAITTIRACLVELDSLLSRARSARAEDEKKGSADRVAAKSLSPFVGDLLVTAGWLGSSDSDSVITAAAFALLAAVLAAYWFALGSTGWQLAARLRRQYLILVAEGPLGEPA